MRARSASSYFCKLIIVLGVTLLLTASVEASADYNADLAVEEVGRLFNLLFPLPLPDKTPYPWRSGGLQGLPSRGRLPRRPAKLFSSQEPSSLNLPKRGESECLKRCVGQGKLHPVQCLTLC